MAKRGGKMVEDFVDLAGSEKDRTDPKVSRLAAKAVIRNTKSAKLLTHKEKEYAAELLTQDASPESPMFQNPLVQEAVIESLHAMGIDNQYIAQKIKDGCEATETKFFAEKGVVTDERQVVAWGPRKAYLDTLLEITKIKQKDDGGSRPIGHLHLHYKSNLTSKKEVIDVTSPKTEQGRRRMQAARPTNRRGV